MTVHPRSRPTRPPALHPGHGPAEVPGLAYSSAVTSLQAPTRPRVRLSAEAEALELMFGYYTQPD